MAVAVVASIFVVGPGRRSTGADAERVSKKPDITQLTRDLLVDKSAFPEFNGGRRKSGLGSNDRQASGLSDFSVSPQECSEFYGYSESATQTAYATVSKMDANGPSSLEVHLAIIPDQPDLKDRVGKCQSFTVSLELLGRTLTFDAQLEPLEASGVPPWAVATVMKSSSSPFPGIPVSVSMTTASISAYYRGVLVVAGYDVFNRRGKNNASLPADGVDDLVRLFDAQIEKLEAAS